MKNLIAFKQYLPNIYTLVFMLGLVGTVQSQNQYESGMKKAFALWTDAKPIEASALFERIAQAEKDNWIPYYYAANTLIIASFETKETTTVNELLKKASSFITKAHSLSPDNSELTTLEGFMYTGYVAMDPATYGMKYSNKIINLHSKAITLDPENPRAQLNKTEYAMGAARFFGEDMTKFCASIKGTVPLFENQKSPVPFYPQFGADRIASLLKQCNCK